MADTSLQFFLEQLESRKEQDGKQGDTAWHEARSKLLTMSAAAALSSFHPQKTVFQEILEKIVPSYGKRSESFVTQVHTSVASR